MRHRHLVLTYCNFTLHGRQAGFRQNLAARSAPERTGKYLQMLSSLKEKNQMMTEAPLRQ